MVTSACFVPIALVLVALSRRDAIRRRRSGASPRIVWSPTPIVSISYWSRGLRALGYESTTLVEGVYHINRREDFDRTFDDLRAGPFAPYVAFLWALLHADVFCLFFDGGFLATTPLALLEPRLLKLAGKRLVVSPYGADIAVPEHLGRFRDAVLATYPYLAERAGRTRRMVDAMTRCANLTIRNLQFGYLPRGDVVWPNQVAIDVDVWRPVGDREPDGEIVVAHSSNHRAIKGTELLVAAIEDLRRGGMRIRLDLYEGRPNEDVRRGLERCDLVAEQFIGGYALAAIEGMAVGKPVLSNMSWLPAELVDTTCLRECPIVDTSPETLRETLTRLADDPDARSELGRRGREYVLRYHSSEAAARTWDAIIRHVWDGIPLRLPWDERVAGHAR
jgi:glycosyltransferase involved in cell wall biosynthesis